MDIYDIYRYFEYDTLDIADKQPLLLIVVGMLVTLNTLSFQVINCSLIDFRLLLRVNQSTTNRR